MDCGYELKILQKIVDPIYVTMCEFCTKGLGFNAQSTNSVDKQSIDSVVKSAKAITRYATKEKKGDSIMLGEISNACSILDSLLYEISEGMEDSCDPLDNHVLFETIKKIVISLAHILLVVDDNKCRLFACQCAKASTLVRNFPDVSVDRSAFEEFETVVLEVINNSKLRQTELLSISQAGRISKCICCISQLMSDLKESIYSFSSDTSIGHVELLSNEIYKNLRKLALLYKHKNYYNDYCPYNAAILTKYEENLNEIYSVGEKVTNVVKCDSIREITSRVIPISIFMTSESTDPDLKAVILKLCHEIICSLPYKPRGAPNEPISLESLKRLNDSLFELRISLSKIACQNLAESIYLAHYPIEELIQCVVAETWEELASRVDDIRVYNRSLLNSFYFISITSTDKAVARRLIRSVVSMEEIMTKIIICRDKDEMETEICNWKGQFAYSITLAANVVDLRVFFNICGGILSEKAKTTSLINNSGLFIKSHSDAYQRASCYLAVLEDFNQSTREKSSKLIDHAKTIAREMNSYCGVNNDMIKSNKILDSATQILKQISTLFSCLSNIID